MHSVRHRNRSSIICALDIVIFGRILHRERFALPAIRCTGLDKLPNNISFKRLVLGEMPSNSLVLVKRPFAYIKQYRNTYLKHLQRKCSTLDGQTSSIYNVKCNFLRYFTWFINFIFAPLSYFIAYSFNVCLPHRLSRQPLKKYKLCKSLGFCIQSSAIMVISCEIVY